MEDGENRAALYAVIDQLPPVQARRVYAHYISRADLARAEGVGISRISGSMPRVNVLTLSGKSDFQRFIALDYGLYALVKRCKRYA